MILEGIVTSLSEAGRTNVAPMGPVVDESMTTLRLRPYKGDLAAGVLKKNRSLKGPRLKGRV